MKTPSLTRRPLPRASAGRLVPARAEFQPDQHARRRHPHRRPGGGPGRHGCLAGHRGRRPVRQRLGGRRPECSRKRSRKPRWNDVATARRAPLGKMLSRKLQSVNFSKTLPGAPAGDYAVALYDTSFEHKKDGHGNRHGHAGSGRRVAGVRLHGEIGPDHRRATVDTMRVGLGMGSNLGDRLGHLRQARDAGARVARCQADRLAVRAALRDRPGRLPARLGRIPQHRARTRSRRRPRPGGPPRPACARSKPGSDGPRVIRATPPAPWTSTSSTQARSRCTHPR